MPISAAEWVGLALPVAQLGEEVAAIIATELGSAGVEIGRGEIVVWTQAPSMADARAKLVVVVERLAAQGFALDPETVTQRKTPPESEWRDSWKRFFRVHRVTRHIVIVPSWESFSPAKNDVVIHLDPGRAFGTGIHASTRLCLAEIDHLAQVEKRQVARVLDLGTGSGVLAVACAKMWPCAIGIAVDDDPVAVDCARKNVAVNEVSNFVVERGRAAEHRGEFDLILANIQADTLLSSCAAIAKQLGGNGTLVLSGLLTEQCDNVAQKYQAHGLRETKRTTLADDSEWTALVLEPA